MSSPRVAQLSPHKERFSSQEPSFHNLQVPLNIAPIQRDALYAEPRFNCLSEFPVKGHINPLSPPPYVLLDPQKGALQRSSHKERCSRSGAIHSSFGLHGKGALPEAPSTEPLERAIPHLHSPFIQLSKSPVDKPSSRFPKSGAPMKRDARLQNLF
jgi:hypothetical protein